MKAAIVLALMLAAAPVFADHACNKADIQAMQFAINHPENFMAGLPKFEGGDLKQILEARNFEYCQPMLRNPEGFSVYAVKAEGHIYIMKLFYSPDRRLSGAYLDVRGAQPPYGP